MCLRQSDQMCQQQSIGTPCLVRKDGTAQAYQRRQRWSRGSGRKIAAPKSVQHDVSKQSILAGAWGKVTSIKMFPSPALWCRRGGGTSQGRWARRSIKLIPSIKSLVSLPYNTMSCVWEPRIWKLCCAPEPSSVCGRGSSMLGRRRRFSKDSIDYNMSSSPVGKVPNFVDTWNVRPVATHLFRIGRPPCSSQKEWAGIHPIQSILQLFWAINAKHLLSDTLHQSRANGDAGPRPRNPSQGGDSSWTGKPRRSQAFNTAADLAMYPSLQLASRVRACWRYSGHLAAKI
ncbi:hypothetical protein V8C35DRAFT_331293 [Trichoderma chlorosporum]